MYRTIGRGGDLGGGVAGTVRSKIFGEGDGAAYILHNFRNV